MNTINNCRVPREWMSWYNSRARRSGSPLVRLGTKLLVSKFPSCEGVVVQITGWSEKCLKVHPLVIKFLLGDCDGDAPQIVVLPDGISCTGMWASQIVDITSFQTLPPDGPWLIPDRSQDDGKEALLELTRSKRGMGPVTIRYRVLPYAYDDLRVAPLPMGNRCFTTRFGLWLCEACISKKASMSLSRMQNLLHQLLFRPQEVAEELLTVHELFTTHEQETREWCQYIYENQIDLNARLKGAPVHRVLTEAPIYWTVAQALECLDEKGLALLKG